MKNGKVIIIAIISGFIFATLNALFNYKHETFNLKKFIINFLVFGVIQGVMYYYTTRKKEN